MKFYRYEAIEYAVLDSDGEFVANHYPNIKVQLRIFNLIKETQKGYWIGYGEINELMSPQRWVSKTARKRYAYPTKEEAMNNFIKRTEKRIKILKRQIFGCEISLGLIKSITS